ncbi:hypothetical protein SDC9_208744 [bioreactor metagenome]|uniref:Uncharacterized protein n=1 Tax=bioreactor metagenome TaxID=1076179 RepID=A0A645JD58_9ZZZZ
MEVMIPQANPTIIKYGVNLPTTFTLLCSGINKKLSGINTAVITIQLFL